MRVIWQGIAATQLANDEGATVVIADHGAHVLSWKPACHREVLFLSDRSDYKAGNAIRGGVPVIFPQFGAMGSGQRHGFARLHDWRLHDEGATSSGGYATYHLAQRDLPEKTWAHSFELAYRITLQARALELSLSVRNTSQCSWAFQAALHTYFRVNDAASCSLNGLRGIHFLDQADGGARKIQREDRLQCRGEEVDRIYLDSPPILHMDDGASRIQVAQEGFRDTVVWNPGPAKAEMLADLAPGGWQQFICLEAAEVANPVMLKSGETWTGKQVLSLGSSV